ncbi:unnamed protein product [Spodoptera littoralis]|uniref:Dynein regulatory complex protein 9 n=1 Tax=Spodoptera littoralis TaxID=7109 RepID=A0A9P0ILI1_SPOLI|nr:unnamed protein product [Spodoptera littoralis]CAH1647183.1 unnamed protein product [Spodoptera littoralis]
MFIRKVPGRQRPTVRKKIENVSSDGLPVGPELPIGRIGKTQALYAGEDEDRLGVFSHAHGCRGSPKSPDAALGARAALMHLLGARAAPMPTSNGRRAGPNPLHSIDGENTSKHSGLHKEESTFWLATDFLLNIYLAECNNQLRLIKTMADMAILRAKKYQIKSVEHREDLTRINTKDMGNMQYKLDKLVADRIYFQEVLEETYLELALYRCFSVLTSCNKEVEEQDLYRICLAEEEGKNKLFDAALNSEIIGRYITNWQCARTEQHTQTINDTESGPSTAISYFRNRGDQEQRVHSEIDLLVNVFINETLAKVESWMNKYDTDMEAIDLKITIMKNKYQDEVAKRKSMEDDLAHHADQMTLWNKFKDDRERARLYRKKMTESAIIVQAWWRGLLVRLELGPFRPKKKAPTRPDDKKGKKK